MNLKIDTEKLSKLFLHPKNQELLREIEGEEENQRRRPLAARELAELLKDSHYPKHAEMQLAKRKYEGLVTEVEAARIDWNRKFNQMQIFFNDREQRRRELENFLIQTAPIRLKDALVQAEEEVRHYRKNPRLGDGDGRNSRGLAEAQARISEIRQKILQGE